LEAAQDQVSTFRDTETYDVSKKSSPTRKLPYFETTLNQLLLEPREKEPESDPRDFPLSSPRDQSTLSTCIHDDLRESWENHCSTLDKKWQVKNNWKETVMEAKLGSQESLREIEAHLKQMFNECPAKGSRTSILLSILRISNILPLATVSDFVRAIYTKIGH